MYAGVHEFLDLNSAPVDINEASYGSHAESFCYYNYKYARKVITMHYSPATKPGEGTYESPLQNVDEKKMLKVDYFLVLLDNQHWRRSVEPLGDRDRVGWAVDWICMEYAFLLDYKAYLLAPPVELVENANVFTVILQRKATFTKAM